MDGEIRVIGLIINDGVEIKIVIVDVYVVVCDVLGIKNLLLENWCI